LRKINKIHKPLAKLTRSHRDSIQINKIRNENRDIKTEAGEIQKIIRSFYQSLHSAKLKYLDEMDNFLDRYQVTKFNQDQINDLKCPITPLERGSQ
jgi:conjugal transfer/entry exclusion protein